MSKGLMEQLSPMVRIQDLPRKKKKAEKKKRKYRGVKYEDILEILSTISASTLNPNKYTVICGAETLNLINKCKNEETKK